MHRLCLSFCSFCSIHSIVARSMLVSRHERLWWTRLTQFWRSPFFDGWRSLMHLRSSSEGVGLQVNQMQFGRSLALLKRITYKIEFIFQKLYSLFSLFLIGNSFSFFMNRSYSLIDFNQELSKLAPLNLPINFKRKIPDNIGDFALQAQFDLLHVDMHIIYLRQLFSYFFELDVNTVELILIYFAVISHQLFVILFYLFVVAVETLDLL